MWKKGTDEGWLSFWDVKIVCKCSGSPIPLQGAKVHLGTLSRDSQCGWASKHTQILSIGDKKWQLGHLRAVWAGHDPIFHAGSQILSWEAEWCFLSWPWPPNTAFVWDTNREKRRLWWWPLQPATGALPQEVLISYGEFTPSKLLFNCVPCLPFPSCGIMSA